MNSTQIACPRCQSPLAQSARPGHVFEPCKACGMRFIDGSQQHDTCGASFAQHLWKCPVQRGTERILCPLCCAGRHRKDKTLSHLACSWRQWAIATGRMEKDAAPDADVPDQSDMNNLREYTEWMRRRPQLEAGSVPAERIFRQRMRERGTLLPR